MKLSAPRIVLILAVGCAIGIGAGWYVISGKLVEGTKAFIAQAMNQQEHPGGARLSVKYDAIERSGFPSIGVRLVNPSLTYETQGDGANIPAIHVSWQRKGTLSIVTEMMAHAYRIESDGSGEVSMRVGDKTQQLSSAPNHSELLVKAKTPEKFKQWQSMDWSKLDQLFAALQEVGQLHIASGPLSLKNTETGDVLFSQGEGSIDIANRSSESMTDFDLTAVLKDSLVTKEYNDFIVETLAMMHIPGMSAAESMPFAAERAGKQNFDIALTVKLPHQVEEGPMPNGEVHLHKLNIQNDFYSLALPFDIALAEKNGRRNADLHVDWSVDIKPAGAAEAKLLIDNASAIPMLASMGDPASLTPEAKEKLLAALPTVSTLGPIRLKVDLNASTPVSDADDKAGPAIAADGKRETLSLKQLAFDHARWGLEAKAEGWRDDKGATTLNGTILCKQCDQFTGDTVGTAIAANEAIKAYNPDSKPLPVNAETQAKLDAVLAEIGQKDAAGNITFTITTPQGNDFRLYGQPINDQLAKLSAVFDLTPKKPEK